MLVSQNGCRMLRSRYARSKSGVRPSFGSWSETSVAISENLRHRFRRDHAPSTTSFRRASVSTSPEWADRERARANGFTNRRRAALTSTEMRRPLLFMAAPMASVFPPAPAHASTTHPPGGGATTSATIDNGMSIRRNSRTRTAAPNCSGR